MGHYQSVVQGTDNRNMIMIVVLHSWGVVQFYGLWQKWSPVSLCSTWCWSSLTCNTFLVCSFVPFLWTNYLRMKQKNFSSCFVEMCPFTVRSPNYCTIRSVYMKEVWINAEVLSLCMCRLSCKRWIYLKVKYNKSSNFRQPIFILLSCFMWTESYKPHKPESGSDTSGSFLWAPELQQVMSSCLDHKCPVTTCPTCAQQLVSSSEHFLILWGRAPWETSLLSESHSKHDPEIISGQRFVSEREISLSAVCRKVVETCPEDPKNLNGCSVGVQLILLAALETFNLTSGKHFLHKLEIIQSKLCKYIRWDKAGGGVAVYCEVKKSEPVVEAEGNFI